MNKQSLTQEQNTEQKNYLLNPFPGLRPFKYEENHLYFGRENQINEVVDKLTENKFVGIIGTSGIGKSSFIYCGLFPILYGDYPTEYASKWEIFTLRPGVSPIRNLAASITEGFARSKKNQIDREAHQDIEYSILTESSMGLVESIKYKYHETGKNYLIFIDQFEEIFRFKDLDMNASEQASAFIKLIANAVNQAEVPIYVVLTMRSDFVGDCSLYPILTSLINESQFLIPQMTRSERREAVIGPIKVLNGVVDEALVQHILNDVGDSPDQLPIMQHALMRTWDYWQRHRIGSEALGISDYEAIGGMEKALSIHANEAFNELDERQKKICEKLFKTITEKGLDGRGIRRPTKLGEIATIANATVSEVAEVIDHFRAVGRTLLMPPISVELDEDSVIDISHESLMRIWVTLYKWVEEEAESVKLYLRLAEAAEMHQSGKAGLWRGPDLQIALSWLSEEKPTQIWGVRYHPAYERTMLFLEFSKKEFEREQINKEKLQKRRLIAARITALVLGLGAVIAILLLLVAEEQRKIADIEKQRAKQQALRAQKESERANLESQRAKEANRIAELEKKEAIRQAEIAKEKQEYALIQEKKANREAERARRSLIEAERQRGIAEERTREAERALERATTAEARAKAEQMRTIASSMAVKSVQTDSTSRKALLAQQAYNFHDRYNGNPHDDYIYQGLYYAVKSLEGNAFNQLVGHSANVRAIASHAGHMYSAGSDGNIIRWNTAGDQASMSLVISSTPGLIHRAIAVSSNGRLLACGGEYGYITVYNTNNLVKPINTISIPAKEVLHLDFLPAGKGVVALTSDRKIFYSDFTNMREVVQDDKINLRGNQIIEVHPQTGELLVGKVGGTVSMFPIDNPEAAKVVYQDPANADIVSLTVNRQGQWLVAGTEAGGIKMANLQTGLAQALIGHKARVNNIAFSDDGKLLATGSFDKTVKIWDFHHLETPPIVLTDHQDWVWSICFDASGKKLLAGCRDNLVRVWPTSIKALSNTICGHPKLDRNLTQNEWSHYVGKDIEYEKTCKEYPVGK